MLFTFQFSREARLRLTHQRRKDAQRERHSVRRSLREDTPGVAHSTDLSDPTDPSLRATASHLNTNQSVSRNKNIAFSERSWAFNEKPHSGSMRVQRKKRCVKRSVFGLRPYRGGK